MRATLLLVISSCLLPATLCAQDTKASIDPAIDEEVQAFFAKRKEDGGAPTDFCSR